MIISTADNLAGLDNGNKFIGSTPVMKNSTINFKGEDNILYCEDGVTLVNSKLIFNGSGSVIYLRKNYFEYILNVTVNNSCTFYMGKDNYINGTLNVVVSEHTNVFIGNNGLFSFGIWLRTADPHLIYDCKNGKRLNYSKSIYLGDHIWVGQSAMILKGTSVESGSIIGAMSLVSGKKIEHNSTYGGNPCKCLKSDIFWENSCVHLWDEEVTNASTEISKYKKYSKKKFEVDSYIYKYDSGDYLSFIELEKSLNAQKNANGKYNYLNNLKDKKNRFVSEDKKSFSLFGKK